MAVETVGIVERSQQSFEELKQILSSRRWQLYIFIITVIFIVVAIFVYNRFFKSTTKTSYVENKEFISGDYVDGIEVLYFYTLWCPICKNANTVWNEFINLPNFTGGKYNGTTIIFRMIDCDKETHIADKFDITGYPTVKLIKGDQVIDFDAKMTVDSLMQFVKTSA